MGWIKVTPNLFLTKKGIRTFSKQVLFFFTELTRKNKTSLF